MSKFFDLDSPIMRFMTKVADIMILNLLFVITCLPLFTIGTSLTALYYVSMKLVREEESGIVHSYFHAFKMNFRQSTVFWLGTVAVFMVVILDMSILARIDSPIAAAMNTGVFILGVLLLMVCQYLFPLVAKFDVGMLQTLKNACLMAVAHLPKTILMTAFVAGCGIITFYSSHTIYAAAIIWTFIGFGLVAVTNSAILVKIFDIYIKKEP